MEFEEIINCLHKYKNYPAYCLILSRELCNKYPNQCIFYLYQGKALKNLSRYLESLELMDVAGKICPDNQQYSLVSEKGHLYRSKKDYKNAIICFKKLVERNPEDAGGHVYLGSIFSLVGNLHQAENCHRKAIQCTYGDIDEAYLNLGYVLRAQERFAEALECFTRALEIDSNYELAELALKDIRNAIEFRSNNKNINQNDTFM